MTAIVVDFNNPEKFPETFAAFKNYLEETSGKIVKKIQFKDDEGDYVTITSDLEYTEAFKAAISQGNLDLQILVEAKPEVAKEIQHAAYCDVCNQTILGIRYKCSNCPNFDLCEACEAVNLERSLHDADHIFFKVYRPITFGIRNTLPNLYYSTVEEKKVEQKYQKNENQSKSNLEARLSKIEGDLKKVQRLMSKKDKLKKEKLAPRRENRFGVYKRKLEVQEKLGKCKEEKDNEIEKEEVKVESKLRVQSVIESEPEIQLKPPEPEIQLKQSEPEIQLVQSEQEIQQEIQLEQSEPQRSFQPWEEQIILLQAMGFLDQKLNLELLDKYQDINRVVEMLIV